MRLVQLKENTDAPETDRKIRSILVPMEYTRLDEMVDVMFTAAKDVEAALVEHANVLDDQEGAESTDEIGEKSGWQFTDSALLQGKREQIVAAMGRREGTNFIKKSRALHWDAEHKSRFACTISKRYHRSWYRYWYAYHPQWDVFLEEGAESFLILGCMELNFAFAIPWQTIHRLLPALNTTTTERSTYWHLHIVEAEAAAAQRVRSSALSSLPSASLNAIIKTTGVEWTGARTVTLIEHELIPASPACGKLTSSLVHEDASCRPSASRDLGRGA